MSDKLSDAAAKAVNGLTDGVTSLVAAFKQLAPHAWEVLVRQQVVEGTINLLVYVLGFIALFSFIRLSTKVAHSLGDDGEKRGYFGRSDPSAALPFVLASFVLGCILMWFTFFKVPTYLGQVVNPEFYAAQFLIENVKK